MPLSIAVARKSLGTKELRAVRRFTWTSRDGLEQFDKLRHTFEAAAFAEDYFCNRALFADHFLLTRLREDPAWQDNPAPAFHRVKELLQNARQRWLGKGEAIVRQELYEPLFGLLGFKAKAGKKSSDARTSPDYLLTGPDGKTAAFVYSWERWLDGPDFHVDQETPEENPGACVVTALEEGVADWIIVTNGRQWRLYSRQAHSRATNFYEVDLVEALIASGETDPNEAFRYWWLFFRAAAFRSWCGRPACCQRAGVPPARGEPRRPHQRRCWLDSIAEGSREYAKQLGERLKERIFVTIFPHLAQGFLEDRKRRMGLDPPADRRRVGRGLRGHADPALPLALPALRRKPRPAADPRGGLSPGQSDEDQGRDRREGRHCRKRIGRSAGQALLGHGDGALRSARAALRGHGPRRSGAERARLQRRPVPHSPLSRWLYSAGWERGGGEGESFPRSPSGQPRTEGRSRAPHRPLPGRAQSARPLPGPGHRPAGPRSGRQDLLAGVHRLQVARSPPPGLDLRGAAGVQAQGRRRGPDHARPRASGRNTSPSPRP